MEQISLKQLFKKGVFNAVSVLRENENGYPYVTLLRTTSKGTASQNVYFGQKTAELVSDTFNVGDRIDSMLADAQVIKTKNADNEVRFKLSTNPTSDYASEQQLADIFGVDAPENNFDTEMFQKGFQVRESVSVGAGMAG